jgi:Flp pilus assembly protein TadD
LAGGVGLEDCLSPRFRGFSLAPVRETILREDGCFEVRRAEWAKREQTTPALDREQFAAHLRRWLKGHAPITLAELDCLEIRESAAPDPPGAEGGQSPPPGVSTFFHEGGQSPPLPLGRNLVTRFRFELSGTVAAVDARPDAIGDRRSHGIHQPGDEDIAATARGLTRWQGSGEWEIDWELDGTSLNPDSAQWKIVAWRPGETVTVRATELIFTDVTRTAFGQDASFSSHLLRDTNYWRAVLDVASGIDIFGNCGVSVGDADGDGKDEIYLCQPQGLPNRLYRQRSPGIFEDVAASAGVDLLDATSMALFADMLNRGRQDLVIITQSQPLLFLNDGQGRFTLAREAFPLVAQHASLTGAALGDYDRDGYLDLYVCSYGYFQGEGSIPVPAPYYDAHNGPPNRLYRNRGDGTFVDVTTASGLDRGNDRFSFACAWADIDDDGWPDLAVINDFGRNNLYLNRHDGNFEDVSEALDGYGSGMSGAFADLDGDGLPDLYVGNMWSPAGVRVTADPEFQQRFADVGAPGGQSPEGGQSPPLHRAGGQSSEGGQSPPLHQRVRQFAMGNALYRNNVAGQALKMGLVPDAAGAGRGRWAWCSDAFDIENDGHLDLYVVNGFLSSPTPERKSLDAYLWKEVVALSPHSSSPGIDYRAAWTAIFQLAHRGHPWNGHERNVCFLNLGEGRFADISAASGLDYRDDGRAFAVFDFDGDGDADLVLHSRTGPQLRLLRNDVANHNHSLALRLTSRAGNRDAIGARVEVETPTGRLVRFLSSGSGFLAQHSKEMVLGLGRHSSVSVVRIRWPKGAVSEYRNLEAGYRYFVIEGEPTPRREPLVGEGSALPRHESLVGEGSALTGHAEKSTAPRREQDSALPIDGEVVPGPISNLRSQISICELAPPRSFSTNLIEPLPLPLLDPLQGLAPSGTAGAASRFVLLWLWDPANQNPSGLDSFLRVKREIPSRLVLWGERPLPGAISDALTHPAWKADSRFRSLISTLLTNIFDYRRELALPTGLLFAVGEGSALPPSVGEGSALPPGVREGSSLPRVQGSSALPKQQAETAATTATLVKIYWGGADSDEVLRDVREGVKRGAAALPFPGRAILCSFRRDYRSLGAALATASLAAEAELFLAQAVEANRQDPDALYNLALVRNELGKSTAAAAAARAALAVRPEFPEAENLLGILLARSAQADKALTHLEKATREAPDFVEAWSNLGYALMQKGELSSARQALERAVSLAPDFPEALNNQGILTARQGDLERARKLFQRVLDLQPENEQAANNLAVLYAKQGKTDEAVATFRALLDRNPEAGSVLLNLARLEISRGKTAEARSLLESWLAKHPGDVAAQQLLQKTK